MRGMILAAGRGERMGALTDSTPKPLLKVGGVALIEYTINELKRANITEIVINVSYQAEKIKATLNDGSQFGVSIHYSEEPDRLDVGGGILKALPYLGPDPFVVMSADIITDYPLCSLPKKMKGLAHLVMVTNPGFKPEGDFGLNGPFIDRNARPRLTYGNIGLYTPALFKNCNPGIFSWADFMFPWIDEGRITGEHFQGTWYNVGTPKELALIDAKAKEDLDV